MSKPKFKKYRKKIGFGFGCKGFNGDLYKEIVGHCHNGVDWTTGKYGGQIRTDNAGYVYKVIRAGETPSNWAGVYILVPTGNGTYMEICYGHCSEILVKVGDFVKEDQIVALEGNKGEVYYGNTRITKAMQDAGDTRGHHVHEMWRPVRRVKTRKKDKFYLEIAGKHPTQKAGEYYRDDQGYNYEVVHENGARGGIDPDVSEYITAPLSSKLIKATIALSGDNDASVIYKFGQLLAKLGL